MYNLIAGLVGCGVASEFRTWTHIYDQMPDISDIFDGKSPKIPDGTDALYALISSMVAYAREHRGELNRIENSIEYASKMPPDFSTVLMKDYMYLEPDYKEKLMKIPEFTKWFRTKGRLLNGNI
jgi:hypothetical protein